ncbi:MAG: YfjI family protein [Rickettsiales bacterium]|nr:YfjI family protein [Pseudomonadota bacterium]MDA0966556.1 YfjI family protein [Pseudomonadota bacterium]MDG4543585.1 YfjI family protein [Rickettsiales bacterium]MDG4545732.1 YfjI family protein [Rickettsiales bacterium]MDG4547495.1 YfjI family protein [Rickettsiales bacterium]
MFEKGVLKMTSNLHVVDEKKEMENAIADSVNTAGWEQPIFPFENLNAPEISTVFLPDNLRQYGKALSDDLEVPESMVVMSIFGVLSSIFSGNFVVSPKSGYNESINIYAIIALPPGNTKSAVFKNVTAPLKRWEEDIKIEKVPEIRKQHSKRKSEEKIIEGLRGKLNKSNIKEDEQYRLIEEIAEKEANLTKPEYLPELWANNATPEAIADRLYEQKGRYAVLSDEGGIIEVMSGLYSGGKANIDVFLQGIDGGDVKILRKNMGLVSFKAYLTFLLIIQPKIIKNMAGKHAFHGKGLYERFFYVIPSSKVGYRSFKNQTISDSCKKTYDFIIRGLLDKSYSISDSEKPVTLKLSKDALNEWEKFRNEIEIELRPNGKFDSCTGWGAKICGYTLRLAGLIHLCENMADDYEISLISMQKAIELAKLLIVHALYAFDEMKENENVANSKRLLKWIVNQDSDEFTRTELLKGNRSGPFKEAKDLDKPIQTLIDWHCISSHERESCNTNKPTTYFKRSPYIKDMNF